VLQQLGYPANVVAGIGLAARPEFDRFIELARTSPRMGTVMDLVAFAKRQSSLTALAAYGSVFEGAFWVARAYGRSEPGTATACLTLAALVGDNARFNAISRLHNRLRTDAIFLHQALDELELDGGQDAGAAKDEPYLLHAVRLALIMRLLLLAARLPTFSARGDISRETVLELLLAMRVDEATAILRDVFPATESEGRIAGLEEPSTYETRKARGYPQIHSGYILPMEEIFSVLKDIGVALSHRFGAYG
jgi:phosphoenolpyruvate carboxylase